MIHGTAETLGEFRYAAGTHHLKIDNDFAPRFQVGRVLGHPRDHKVDSRANCLAVLRTFAAMSAPCSVKASGGFRRPPHPELDAAKCNFKSSNSSFVSRNAKSTEVGYKLGS